MKIEVLGDGCARCNQLYENVLEAVKLSGTEVDVTKDMDVEKIADHQVKSMPAVLVDGVVKTSGKVPKVSEILTWIK